MLLRDIDKLGKLGDIREIKDGYGRNYLIPKGWAALATEENLRKIEKIKKEKEKEEEKKRRELLNIKAKLEKLSLTILVEAKDDYEIYGSVNKATIIKALKNEGIELSPQNIELTSPIKKLGVYNVKVSLGYHIKGELKVWVVKK